jgi:L-ascorbate metabolism protein UlaG (beta-lactamase superfamily)
MSLTLRWLGVAGLEFTLAGRTLLVDPMVTRPSPWQVISFRRVLPRGDLVAQYIHCADDVLVSHAHYDHLLDVPEVLKQTGARAYGSRNTGIILGCYGLPAERFSTLQTGDCLDLGPFQVEVFPASHTRTPFDRWIDGPLPERAAQARTPLRLVDYRMDECFSFRIHAAGITFLVGNHPAPADVLLIDPFHAPDELAKIVAGVAPQVVAPVHWENFMRPLSKPQRPMLVTRQQGWRGWPPLRSLDLRAFSRCVERAHPGTKVIIPELFAGVDFHT